MATPPPMVGTPTSVAGSGSVTTALALPTGAATGNVAVWTITHGGNQTVSSDTRGAIERGVSVAVNNTNRLRVFTKKLVAGDIGQTQSFTFTGSQAHVVTCSVWDGDDFDAISATFSSNATAALSQTLASFTPGVADCQVISVVSSRPSTLNVSNNTTFPAGPGEIVDAGQTGNINRLQTAVANRAQSGGPTAYGPYTLTFSTASTFVGCQLSIKPASVNKTAEGGSSAAATSTASKISSKTTRTDANVGAGATARKLASRAARGDATVSGSVAAIRTATRTAAESTVVSGQASARKVAIKSARVDSVASGRATVAFSGPSRAATAQAIASGTATARKISNKVATDAATASSLATGRKLASRTAQASGTATGTDAALHRGLRAVVEQGTAFGIAADRKLSKSVASDSCTASGAATETHLSNRVAFSAATFSGSAIILTYSRDITITRGEVTERMSGRLAGTLRASLVLRARGTLVRKRGA